MFRIKLRIQQLSFKYKTARIAHKTSKQVGRESIVWVLIKLLLKICILAFGVMVVLFPFYFMIAGSLMNYDEIAGKNPTVAPDTPMWENYKDALVSGYWKAILITAIITFISIVFKMFITILMGYAFSLPQWRGKKVFWAFLLSIMMLPEVALLSGQFAVVTNLQWRAGVMLIASISLPFVASVFSGLMFKNAFEKIPVRMKEASMVDGASEIKYFVKVALPAIRSTIWTVGILTAFAAWNSYMWPALLLDGDTQVMSTWLFTTGIPADGGGRIQTQVRLAAAILAILPMFIVYFGMRSRIMKAISRQGSGVKG